MVTDNLHEYSVSEISGVIKNLVESNLKHIKIRGEISGYKLAPSGHAYFSLKDQDALINAICWRGTVSKLTVKPEDGLEVIATGYVTTYPGQSKYQIIVEQIQHSGEGALMALLEERKKKLAKEGLFDQSRKKPIPYLPETIGIITSPTGAVIQDIIHRIKDRFPTKILLWPVNVQGELAAGQITAAINGFNELHLHGITPPDVIIVARGGGSIEDLWPFNEEIVARATANSKIPIISAVGHETDTTLIDYVSDLRAPTPTAAAELAVPVRIELQAKINNIASNLDNKIIQYLQLKASKLELYESKFPNLMSELIAKSQRLDDITTRLNLALPRIFRTKQDTLKMFFLKLTHPKEQISRKSYELSKLYDRSLNLFSNLMQTKSHKLNILQNKLSNNFKLIDNQLKVAKNAYLESSDKLEKNVVHYFDKKKSAMEFSSALLESYSFNNTLKRGYSIVKTEENKVIKSKSALTPNTKFIVQFADGECEIHS